MDRLTHTARLTRDINADFDAISNLSIGDGVSVCLWTDAEAYTIIAKTAKTITLQQDKATLSPDWKPEFTVGGFAGHCVNQNEQTYTYERDPNGHKIKISARSWPDDEGGRRFKWKKQGVATGDLGGNAWVGRRKFHDYNF